ncbi:hypothetical protein OBK28_09400 [Empedobacter falsenii]
MSNNSDKNVLVIAAGTLVTAIVGTTMAAPAAIGAGVCLAIWGINEMRKS